MTTRLDHTNCTHAATPAGRKACRAGNAVVREARNLDSLVVDGTHYSVRQVVAFATLPAEVRVSAYMQGTGWVDLGWRDAHEFAGAALVRA